MTNDVCAFLVQDALDDGSTINLYEIVARRVQGRGEDAAELRLDPRADVLHFLLDDDLFDQMHT